MDKKDEIEKVLRQDLPIGTPVTESTIEKITQDLAKSVDWGDGKDSRPVLDESVDWSDGKDR